MKDRLVKFMSDEGLTAVRLAQQLGVQPSTISHILSGRNNPRFELLSALMRNYPALDERWLMLGEGRMYKAMPEVTNVIEAPVQQIQELVAESKPVAEPEKIREPEPVVPTKTTDKIVFFNSDGTFSVYANK